MRLRQLGSIFEVLHRRDAVIITGMALAQPSKEAPVAESSAAVAVFSHDDEISKAIGVPMRRLLAGLARLPKPWTTFLALVLAVLVGVLDYATGYDLQVTGFYLIPIGWASWAAGRKS